MRFSTLLLAAGLALALGESAAAEPRSDVVIGMTIEPAGLDPTIAAPVSIGQIVWQNVFQGLTRIAEDGSVQPQLARSWTVSEDGLTYEFELQGGVRFHNGAPFDSTVAKFALDRARGPGSANPQRRFFAAIDSVEAPEPGRLLVHLSRPAGNLPYWLGWPASVMVEPASADQNRLSPVGTGPFTVAEWKPGDSVRLARVDDYWDKARTPRLAEATFRFIGDAQAQAAALRSGRVDAFPEFAAPELYAALEADPAFETVVGDTELKVVAGMNLRRPPFDDVRVRRALMMAIDRQALVDGAWSGYGTPIGSHYTPNDAGFKDLAGRLSYDVAAARDLLAQAGYGGGLSFDIKVPQMAYATRSAEILQALLAEIGVTLRIVPTEFPAAWVSEVLQNHDFDMTIVAHAEPMDIDIFARPDYYFGYANPAFDDIIARAEAAADDAGREALYGQAQELLADDVPALFLFVMPKLGVWKSGLTGLWHNEPIPSNDLTDVGWSRG